jgi:hypothetical protein
VWSGWVLLFGSLYTFHILDVVVYPVILLVVPILYRLFHGLNEEQSR